MKRILFNNFKISEIHKIGLYTLQFLSFALHYKLFCKVYKYKPKIQP